MPRRQPAVIEFERGRLDEVLTAMADFADGSGWLILQPAFDADDAPRRLPSAGLFTNRVMAIAPACTWVPGERTRNGIEHVALGIEHAARTKVVPILDDAGVAVPEAWVIQQDNPRRGLVIAVPPAVPHDQVLGWLLAAAAALTIVPLNGEWRALVYRR